MHSRLVAVLGVCGLLAAPAAAQEAPAGLAIKVGKIIPVSGPPVDSGVILVKGRTIEAIGKAADVAIPAGYRVLDAGDGWACPGFVDLHNHIGGSMWDINDMVHPTNPELSTGPTIEPQNLNLVRAARWGVTTVLYIPGSGTNISGFGVLMKTWGTERDAWLVRDPGAMKVAQGYNPERWGGDLGHSRMGMWWALERTLDRGKAYAAAWAAHLKAEGPQPVTDPELENLRAIFERRCPVIVHTAGARDIAGTVRMFKERYGLWVIASHGCFDAYKAADAMAASDVPVNLGPRTSDYYFATVGRMQPVAAVYLAAGVKKFSLNTDAPVIPAEELFLQGTLTVQQGVDVLTTIAALTIEPATAVGIHASCGSLEPGKDADIYVTSGNPLDPRSRPLWTVVRGALALDHTKPSDDRLPIPRSMGPDGKPNVRFRHEDGSAEGHVHAADADGVPLDACPVCGGFEEEEAKFKERLGK